ncbi:hypothetical protein VTL71DRAFT_11976 [Oculimacula yallundae]|uniref:Ribosome biogenesis protein SLX9 n=1 Tax=Oculimacula yallundae TaxID=86028 RepID=A0ABR4CRK0_9HELO
MAPTAPKKRPSIRAKSTSHAGSGMSSRPPPKHSENSIPSSSFSNTKKDKRVIKSSSFLNRIEKSQQKPLKRRRPSKKLVTTLESLADALPDVESLVQGGREGGAAGKKMEMKSLKSKPGARKRKEKLEAMERERFGRNMAVIMKGGKEEGVSGGDMAVDGGEGDVVASTETSVSNPTVNRFAALRAWVNANMEKHPAFEEKK